MTTSGPDPDDSTLTDVLGVFLVEGFDAQMGARPGGRLICFTCRAESDASEMTLAGLRRTEGVSDPDDMLAVAALICPNCGARGTVALGYGPESDPDDADVLIKLER